MHSSTHQMGNQRSLRRHYSFALKINPQRYIWIYDKHRLQKSVLAFCLFSCSSLFLPWRVTPFPFISLTSPSHFRSRVITSNRELPVHVFWPLKSQKQTPQFLPSIARLCTARVRTYEQKIEIASNAFFHSLPSLARLLFLLEASGCGSIITKLALPDDTCMLESLFTVPIHGSACRHY